MYIKNKVRNNKVKIKYSEKLRNENNKCFKPFKNNFSLWIVAYSSMVLT